jgi:hypothetical protein
MKRVAAFLVALVMVFSFSACEGPLEDGKVYEKTYTPSQDWDTMGGYEFTCLPGFDGKADCKYKYSPFVIEHHHIDECYKISYSNLDRKDSVCVSAGKYDSVAVGDYFVRSER